MTTIRTYTVSSVTYRINTDAIDGDILYSVKWWMEGTLEFKRITCPFVMCHKSCNDICGDIFENFNPYKSKCPHVIYGVNVVNEIFEQIHKDTSEIKNKDLYKFDFGL